MRSFSVRFLVLTAALWSGLAALAAGPAAAQSQNASAQVLAVADAFHAALHSGDSAAVMRLIADDGLMLEAGGVETRAQYEKDHLPADIEFEKTTSTQRKMLGLTVVGNAAWAVFTSDVTGTFENRPVDFIGTELMVLSRESAGWRIRAIHWGSRARRPPQG